jgi:NAD(P)-dependent dehydrogenase (short-subunit alcohol dehydrogenase family)
MTPRPDHGEHSYRGSGNPTPQPAQLLGPKGIRADSAAPGPVWTPLIPSTMPEEAVESFGSYVSGAPVAVTGGKPVL